MDPLFKPGRIFDHCPNRIVRHLDCIIKMPVKLPAPKHKTEDRADMLVISVPTLKIWPLIFVFGIWSLMWITVALGFMFTISSDGLDAGFVIMWTILGIFIL